MAEFVTVCPMALYMYLPGKLKSYFESAVLGCGVLAVWRNTALCRGTLNLVAEVQEVQKRYMVQEVHMEKEAKQ